MAKATKKKTGLSGGDGVSQTVEMSPREAERLALVEACADADTLSALWDSFADEIDSTAKGVKESAAHSVNGALSLGARVVEFAKNPEVQAQIALANHDKKGQPWKEANWVAAQLEAGYKGMPTAKHLGDCARAYSRALETGQLSGGEKNLRKLLGWSPSAVPALTGKALEDAQPPRLPAPPKEAKDDTDPADPVEVDPRAELITVLNNANETIQYWVDACKEKNVDMSIEAVQEQLALIMSTLETIE